MPLFDSIIQGMNSLGGGIMHGLAKVSPQINNFVKAVESGSYSEPLPTQSPTKILPPAVTSTPTPLKSAILGIQDSTPKPTVVPTASSEATPTMSEILAGRTDKFNSAKNINEEGYKKILSTLDELGATPLEKQLALDVAAQESMLGKTDKNYNWPVSTSRGPFMFNNGTWGDYLKANPSGGDQSDVKDATAAFLYAIRNGITGQGLSRWNASRDVWGKGYTPEELSQFKR